MMIKEGDKVCSKELPCLGVGIALCDELSDGIVTVCWEKDPHGHLPEDHSPLEDWESSDLMNVAMFKHCSKCRGDDATTHSTNEHSERWVDLADARQTGEVLFMPAMHILSALRATLNELDGNALITTPSTDNQYVHVDRRIVQALVDAIKADDPYGDISVGIWENYDAVTALETLEKQLADNPVREDPDQ